MDWQERISQLFPCSVKQRRYRSIFFSVFLLGVVESYFAFLVTNMECDIVLAFHSAHTLTLRLLMSYIYIYIYVYGAHILDVSRSHTTTQHSR